MMNKLKRVNVRIYLETLGCSKNQVDSEIMIGIYEKFSYMLTYNPMQADVIVVNTCGFINDAKVESVNAILEMAEYKEHGICKVLIVTGCLSQRYAYDLAEQMPEVDAFIGTAQFDKIVEVTEMFLNTEVTRKCSSLYDKKIFIDEVSKILPSNMPRILLSPPHMAFLKISEGCDNMCAYCIIPKIRGKYRSRPMEDIISEAVQLVNSGVKELILIAQDTTRYGIDIYNRYALSELLIKLNNIANLKWIRLQYMYPDVIDYNLIQTIARLDKVVKYIDIPIQHGSNSVLKRMNRHTTVEQIRDVVNSFRMLIPNVIIRTTCIVGFPAESDKEFQELKQFILEMQFDRLGAFIYSPEEDTPANKMKNHIHDEIKQNRHDELMALQMNISSEKLYSKIGSVMEVVLEELIENEKGSILYAGRSYMDSPEIDGVVYVNTNNTYEIGDFVKVRIVDALEYDLIGNTLFSEYV